MAWKIDPKTGIATDETGNTVQAANPITPAVAPVATPATPAPAQTNQFYRIGQDIYNASDNIKIGSTDWQNNWATSGAKEIKAATLYSPEGKSQVVGVGTPEASRLLGSGYSLNKPTDTGISADTLGDGATPIDLGGTDGLTGGNDAFMAGIEDYISKLTPPETETSKQEKTLADEVADLAGEVGVGRGAEQLSAEEQAGVNIIQTQLDDVNSNLSTKIAERNIFTANYQKQKQALEGAGVQNLLVSQLEGKQAQLYKMYLAEDNVKVSEIGLLQAQSLGLSGKLDRAQAVADRAVDLKYDDQIAEFNAKAKQLELIQGQLSKEEKTYADAVALQLADEAQALVEKKAEEKTQINYALQNMNDYKDAGINLTDDFATVNSKVLGSATYKAEQVKKAGVGTGTAISTGISKENKSLIENNLVSQKGLDGFVSPDDYNLAKKDWIQAGGEPDDFDKKFKGRRDPENPYYDVTGKISPKNTNNIIELKDQNYTKEEITEAGYDEYTVNKVFEEQKSDDKKKWYQFWK